jgi:methionine aminotransferase
MQAGHNQYPPMPGVPALREAVARKIEALYGRAYDPDTEITITAGATQAILTAILAIVHPGDEVIVLEPCYDSYVPNIELAGGKAVRVPLTPGTFRPDFDQDRRAPSRRAPAPSSSTARTTPAPPSGRPRTCASCKNCWRPPTSC